MNTKYRTADKKQNPPSVLKAALAPTVLIKYPPTDTLKLLPIEYIKT